MADSAAIAEMHAAFGRMRTRADVRNHFHAGFMAALNAVNESDSADEQAAAIQTAQDEYVARLLPEPTRSTKEIV